MVIVIFAAARCVPRITLDARPLRVMVSRRNSILENVRVSGCGLFSLVPSPSTLVMKSVWMCRWP